MKDKSKLYFGGMPTDIEVRKLNEKFPAKDLREGDVITHDDIEDVTGLNRRINRYRTVTRRWRKLLERDHGIITGCKPEGFKVMDDGEKVKLSSSKLRTSARMARRSYVVASKIDPSKLKYEEREEYDFNVRRSCAVLQAAKLKSKVSLPEID